MSYLSTFSRTFATLRDDRDAEDILSGIAAQEVRHDWLKATGFAVGALMCSVGDVTFLQTRTTALKIRKGGLSADLIGIARVNEGGCRIRFGDDALDVTAGDTFSFAAERNMACDSPVYMDKSLIMVPRQRLRALGLGEGPIRSRSAFIGGEGLADILFGHFGTVARRLHDGPSLSHKSLGAINQSVIDMTAALLEETTSSATGEPQLVTAAKAYVDEHLLDHELTPASVAAAMHVSIRTLYRSFTYSDLGVAEYIRDARLLRARRELIAAGGSASIRLVAQRWGFADPSYFSKLFTQRFGCTPSACTKNP